MSTMEKLENELSKFYSELTKLEIELNSLAKDMEDFDLEDALCREDIESIVDDFLDDEYSVTIAGLEYSASRVRKEIDPIAYRQIYLDYVDTLNKEDTEEYHDMEEDYKNLSDEIESIQEQIDELENEIEKLQNEIEPLEEEDND